ncbi:hypothetical protein J7F03_18115 [Streptomyces sp. ISL-43]|uniref:hypothetical protein n=1 Tax=Streptomyces sp. ISL-43 TaxID=2819183 RepID=UPI001BECB705|nr:hypothetical protein [Streptomyces sp. ISL-43]MBT2448976.1 hypothetical protein [Streptomyces sp. ISL-43]
MGTTGNAVSERRSSSGERSDGATPAGEAERPQTHRFLRFLPGIAAYLVLAALLLLADTSASDVARYTGYALWGVVLPGTLVFRALRRRPHTLVEDLAYGAVTGLALELAAWFVLVSLGAQSVATAWPLAVVVPFLAVPGLRRHWCPRGYARTSLGWSWSVSGLVMLTGAYFYQDSLSKYPVLSDSETSRIFADLPYLLSLAANAKQHVPLTLPQASGEPLHYHWFSFAHMAMSSMVGHIDLPVIQTRLMVPALAALAVVLTAVVARRLTGRAWAGPPAVVLLFVVTEFTAIYPNNVDTWTLGAPSVRLMYWSSLSYTYSQPLLIALMGAVGEALRRLRGAGDGDGTGNAAPAFGRGLFVLVALFALASSAAKASTLPVTIAGLALAGLVVLIATRRIPWTVVGLGAILASAQLFATAVIFKFETYGLQIVPLGNLAPFWADPDHKRSAPLQALLIVSALFAFVLYHHLKLVGMIPLILRRRSKLDPLQWFLLGSAVAGPCAYLLIGGYNSSYFTMAALPFGAVLSAWGCCEAFERAALPRRAQVALAVGTVAFVALLTYVIYRYSAAWQAYVLREFSDGDAHKTYYLLLPSVLAGAALAAIALVCGLLWWAGGRVLPALRGRGAVVLMTAVLATGAPGVFHDALQARKHTWMGSWTLPASQVDAARWVRAHSDPGDVLVTNSHGWELNDAHGPGFENTRSWWLGAYSERSVLIEGWAYAPRMMALTRGDGIGYDGPFWDQALFKLNEDAVYRPTQAILRRLHDEYRVRYVVVLRTAGAESPRLGELAQKEFDNKQVAVYRIP